MSTHSVITEQITPKQAAAWLDRNYKHNRPLNSQHVDFLAREMNLGRFTIATIHFMYVGNDAHLVNGQHTLNAIVTSGKPQTCVVIREHNCKESDLPRVYMHYDVQRRRSFGDSAAAFSLHEKMGIPKSWVEYTAGAIKFATANFHIASSGWNYRKLAVADLFEMVPKWSPEIKLILDAIEGGNNNVTRVIKKQAVLSIALITAYYQPEQAHVFWNKATHNDGLSVGDPCRALYEYLPKTIAKQVSNDPVPRDVIARAVSYCWNAHFEDRLLTLIRVRQRERNIPIKILGTQYDGNQNDGFWPTRSYEKVAA